MEAKGFDGSSQETGLTSEEVLGGRPLFESFDPSVQGGIGVTEDGRVFEVRHIDWARQGQTGLLPRTSELPYAVNGHDIPYGIPLDDTQLTGRGLGSLPVPWAMSMGKEVELGVQRADGSWHQVTQDGSELIDAEGNATPRPSWVQPEAYKHMVEYDTGIAFGTEDLRRNTIAAAAKAEALLEEKGLFSPYGTVHPVDVTAADVNSDEYVQKTSRRMNSIREFTGNSSQLHVQMLSVPAGIHALNHYQRFQAVTNLITAAAPIRDGRFDQTIDGHFNQPGAHDNADGFDLPRLNGDSVVGRYGDESPHDWREISRIGSPSAGVIGRAADPSLAHFLRSADQSLRNGAVISSVRELGWHSDRIRIDKGTIEICNLGTSGGNLHKMMAVDELVGKYLMAEQMRYLSLPPTEQAAEKARYAASVEVAETNNLAVTMYGKQAALHDETGQPQTADSMLRQMIDIIDRYGPGPLREGTEAELIASLEPVVDRGYDSADQVFEDALRPLSPMTNNDALRAAHRIEPDVPANELLIRYARARRDHTYEMAAQHLEPAHNVRIGNLAMLGAVERED